MLWNGDVSVKDFVQDERRVVNRNPDQRFVRHQNVRFDRFELFDVHFLSDFFVVSFEDGVVVERPFDVLHNFDAFERRVV